MRNWSGTARRLLLGFGSLFLGSIEVDEAAAGGARFTLRLPASPEGGPP